ncbi:hypothetical protein KIW84_061602 [Lathyrus oleraceus]|uniref:Uncharacterized protein n=1 Tax=Pisum sativum TaxID=3888 RepID=A0A9D4W2Y3_PEA|nr:hypothetical protein KIW84_061602 [Pisum sativum]
MLLIRGRATLINFVLMNLHVHHLLFYKAHVKVIQEIVSIQRRFIWLGSLDRSRMAWISWNSVCKPKEFGGIRDKDVGMFNRVLISKWLWRFIKDGEAIWLGNNDHTPFWFARWIGNNPLKSLFPGLFEVSERKCLSNILDVQILSFDLMVQINLSLSNLAMGSIPLNVKIFGWRLLLERLPAHSNLAIRNVINSIHDKILLVWKKIGKWVGIPG